MFLLFHGCLVIEILDFSEFSKPLFDEIFKHPSKYPFPNIDFQLYIDVFFDCGKDPHSLILNHEGNSFSIVVSEFSVRLPEVDQSIFYTLKHLEYKNCLVKFEDNDILLSALL